MVELLIRRFAIVSTGWKTKSSAIPAEPLTMNQWIVPRGHQHSYVPDPSSLAMPDSRLYSLPDEPRAGARAGGDILVCGYEYARDRGANTGHRSPARIKGGEEVTKTNAANNKGGTWPRKESRLKVKLRGR